MSYIVMFNLHMMSNDPPYGGYRLVIRWLTTVR